MPSPGAVSLAEAGSRPTSVAVVGLGNIGGFLVGLLARLPGLGRLILVDRDLYEAKNVFAQDITAADVGTPKAIVQAERVRRINPHLHVEAIVGDVAAVPLGVFRRSVVCACVDSRRARQIISGQVAWRLGVAMVDSGVHADGCLARVNVYLPAPDQSCLECAWNDASYSDIEQPYPCLGDAPAPAATNAPASLGALAAALQALEVQKLLRGEWELALIGKQVIVDAAAHRHFVTSFRRNATCRFDHATWDIDTLDATPRVLSVGAALALAARSGDPGGAALCVEGQVFVRQLTCPSCGATRAVGWQLSGRLGDAQQCLQCGRRMLATGFDVAEWLRADHLAPNGLAAPLSSLGVCTGDVLTVRTAGGERHVQLGHVAAAHAAGAAHPSSDALPSPAAAADQSACRVTE